MMLSASRAKAAAFLAAAPAPPRMQRRVVERFVPPLASLAAIPTRPLVQRKCASCAAEEAEERLPVQARLEVGPVAKEVWAIGDRWWSINYLCGFNRASLYRCNRRWNLVNHQRNGFGNNHIWWRGHRCNSRNSNNKLCKASE